MKFKLKETNPKKLKLAYKKLALSHINNLEKISCWNKKKKYFKKKQNWKNFTLVIDNKMIENTKKKNDKKCYHDSKKDYFTRNYSRTVKTSISISSFYANN